MVPTKTKKLFARRRASGGHQCIACGRPIASAAELVSVQGGAFHVACALYSRRRT